MSESIIFADPTSPFYPETTHGLNIVNQTCLSTKQIIELKQAVDAQTWHFGTAMLIIGVIVGYALTIAYPYINQWVLENWPKTGPR